MPKHHCPFVFQFLIAYLKEASFLKSLCLCKKKEPPAVIISWWLNVLVCIVEVEGKENWWEQLSRLFSFSFFSTSFRLPSLHSPHTLFGVGNTEHTASETSHVETSCLQAGECSVKGEKTSISVGEEKISWISRDRLIPKCLLCLHKHLWTSAK